MLELIPKQKIEEASRDYTEQHYGKRQVDTYIHESFDAGVDFALKEVKPLIYGFAKFYYQFRFEPYMAPIKSDEMLLESFMIDPTFGDLRKLLSFVKSEDRKQFIEELNKKPDSLK